MKFPEPWNPMKSAMNPILYNVRKEHDGHKLNDERQGSDPLAEGGQGGEGENGPGRHEGKISEDLHHQAADEVIKEVFAPLGPKDFLLGFVGENPFDRDEEKAGEEDVQDEPIEAEENGGLSGGEGGGARTANQAGEQYCNRAASAESFSGTQYEA